MDPEQNQKQLALEPEIEIDLHNEDHKRKVLLSLLFVGMFLSFLAILGTYNLLKTTLATEEDDQILTVQERENREKELNEQYEPIKKIAYISGDSLNVYNIETDTVKSVYTGDQVSSLTWKTKHELTFSQCLDNTCQIKNINLENEQVSVLEKITTERVIYLKWSRDNKVLAYLYKSDINEVELSIADEEGVKTLGTYSWNGDEFYDFNDSVYIRFSPNSEKIMLVNTFSGEDYVTILNLKGESLDSLVGQYDKTPSFAFFVSNETIYYKKGDYLYVKSIGSEEETRVTDRIVGAFGFNPSPDKSKITYWTYDWPTGITTMWVYEIGAGKIKRFKDQESQPLWLDNSTIISLKTSNCRECPLNDLEYVSFDRADFSTSVVEELVKVEDLQLFAIDTN